MGQRIIIFDDLTGEDGDDIEPRTWALGKRTYEADLSEKSYRALCEALAPFIAVAHPPGKAHPPGRTPEPTRSYRYARPDSDDERAALAAWCDALGVTVARPGRPPAAVLDAFRANDPTLIPDRYRNTDDAPERNSP